MATSNFPDHLSNLYGLLQVDSPTGDEIAMVDHLSTLIASEHPGAKTLQLGSSLIVQKGKAASVAVMAHIDTTGFTFSHNGVLIPIGSPDIEVGDLVRPINCADEFAVERSAKRLLIQPAPELHPGDRLVYAAKCRSEDGCIVSPYLDNRAGIWAALETLRACDRVVIAFTSGEEVSGFGARICAKYLYEQLKISRVLISDITWATETVHIGLGPAISRRDASIPDQRYVDSIIGRAQSSGIPYQVEVESDGGSDGAHIESGSHPIEWAFVGAPESSAHSSQEKLSTDDLTNMAHLLATLVDHLSS